MSTKRSNLPSPLTSSFRSEPRTVFLNPHLYVMTLLLRATVRSLSCLAWNEKKMMSQNGKNSNAKPAKKENLFHTDNRKYLPLNTIEEIQTSFVHGLSEFSSDHFNLQLSPKVPKKKPKKKSPIQKRGRLEAVYCSQTRKSRPVRRTLTTEKGRKRSASASPVLGRRKSDSPGWVSHHISETLSSDYVVQYFTIA